MDKQGLRSHLRALRRSMTADDRASASAAVCRSAMALPELHGAGAVHVYLSLPDEVATAEIISALMDQGVDVVVPWMEADASMSSVRLLPEDVEAIAIGPRGVPAAPVRRAVAADTWDVVLVPVVGVDRGGNRLGNGAGHYDRLLSGRRCPTVGLAFDCQIMSAIPVEDHDMALDVIVTPTQVHRTHPRPERRAPVGTGR